jgi:predicted dehydrogenase
MTTNTITRRKMLKKAAAATSAMAFPALISSSALGKAGYVAPSDRLNVALISCGSRSGVAEQYKSYPKSEVVAVCDPITERRLLRKKQFGNCPDFNDFRDVLARPDVDAVHISTADHWHVPISMAAARAGKDMYTEKPLGISIEQDLTAREIRSKYNRIFQYGTQNRSMIQVRMGIELVLNGHIGDVKKVHVWCPQGEFGGSTKAMPIPKGFDYDMWLGPAPKAPFNKDRCLNQAQHNGIFHIYDYAIGFIAGWGAHPMDQLQWWADQINLGIPMRYKGYGVLPAKGLFNTITHWNVTCTYENGLEMCFMDNATARSTSWENTIPHLNEMQFYHGTLFEGTKGWVAVTRGGWKVYPESLYKIAKEPGAHQLLDSKNHLENFVDSVLERKQPISDLDSAIQSDIICHLSEIAVRNGREIKWDPKTQTIVGDSEAQKRMHRDMRAPWTL